MSEGCKECLLDETKWTVSVGVVGRGRKRAFLCSGRPPPINEHFRVGVMLETWVILAVNLVFLS